MADPQKPAPIYVMGACALAAAAIFLAAQGAPHRSSSATTEPTTSPLAIKSQSRPIADAVAAKAIVDLPTMKIAPADSLKGDLSWSPLTGDGSN